MAALQEFVTSLRRNPTGELNSQLIVQGLKARRLLLPDFAIGAITGERYQYWTVKSRANVW